MYLQGTWLREVNGFSPVWILLCFLKSFDCEKLLTHFVHLKGFSPVCVLSCFFKLPYCEKLLSHFEHLNGFSPVWVLSCVFKLHATEKLLSHLVHLNGFSPVWVLIGPLMYLQAACYWEALVTLGAFEWFLSCVGPYWSSHVLISSKYLDQRSFCYIWCTWMVPLLCGSSYDSWNHLIVRSSCHTLCIWMVYLLCCSSHVSSNDSNVRSSYHTLCTGMVSLLCGSSQSHVSKMTWVWNAFITLKKEKEERERGRKGTVPVRESVGRPVL